MDDPEWKTASADRLHGVLGAMEAMQEKQNLLSAQIADLQEVVRLLVWHEGNRITDPEAQQELDEASLGTPMQRR